MGLLLAAVAISTALSGCGSSSSKSASTVTVKATETVTATLSSTAAVSSISPTSEASRSDYKLGETFVFADATFTFNKVEVVESVELTTGGTITADPGEELIIVYGHYVNTTRQPQEYCGVFGGSVYPFMFDTNGTATSSVDGKYYKIPGAGSHQCHEALLPGQGDDFVYAQRALIGAIPAYVELQDKRADNSVRVALQ